MPGDLVIAQVDGLHVTFGDPGLVQHLDETHARQGGVQCRLDDDRAAGRDRRADLVHDQVERMVEGGVRQDHADRVFPGQRHVVGRRGVQVHRDFLACLGAQHFHATMHAVDRPGHFDLGIRQRLAAFAGRFHGQLLAACRHQLRGFLQDLDTLCGRQPA